MLEGGRHDEIAPAAENAGRLRPVDRLAAGEGDEIGPLGDETPEIGLRRQLRCGVDDDRDRGGVRHRDDAAQGGRANRSAT